MSQDQSGPASKIKHVFVLVLENRSFDHMLGLVLGAGVDAQTGSPTTADGPTDETNVYNGVTYSVRANAPYVLPVDPPHEYADVQLQLTSTAVVDKSGKYPPLTLGGYVDSYGGEAVAEKSAEGVADPGVVMACYTPQQLPVLGTLAREFAVCDRWFSSMPGPTWPNRFFLHAATSGGLDRSPTGMEIVRSQFGGYQFENGSIFEALDRAGLQWRVYCGDPLPQVSALSVMTLETMRTHYRKFDYFADDLRDSDFDAAYVFIEPNYGVLERPLGDFQCGNSQHPKDDVTRGEALVKQTYEAIRQSPLWESSLLVVTYDEHGGFYDHVPPPAAVPPGDVEIPGNNGNGFTFELLGTRVPAVVVSPWVPDVRAALDGRGCNLIDHTEYDHTSLLSTVERLFGLPSLTDRDAAANDFLHLLSARQPRDTPRTLPSPAESGFECGVGRIDFDPADAREPVDAALRGFVQLAAIQERRLEPQASSQIADRAEAITTKAEASRYLVEVAAKMRTAGFLG
ncbi:phosphoesterase [Rhizocola hellebori]|uniref:Phosphoesterase n=1 Tax=Rhizocola hellebori TaxID=1392758 RepID=A0A8J3VDR7_9ACTN|nr:alkaline phosphatase family protein [Rhizocola hellebori]GIH02965.1 phosphoesterase [Rhizocola hellebori]